MTRNPTSHSTTAPIAAARYFEGRPYTQASAPGRVNLLGEHTDYNDGFMLPIATPQRTTVCMEISAEPGFRFYSATLGTEVSFGESEEAPAGFARYIYGCIRLLEARGVAVPPLRVHVDSSVPLGTGLSSSAALEVATLRALRSLLGIGLDALDDVALALVAQQAEIQYAGVNCGVMDQMASSLADEVSMLFLDARTLATKILPLPAGADLIVIDSGVARTLEASKYNERRAECERAASLLGVPALRDVTDVALVAALPEPVRRRARHVVSENLRVLEAVKGVSAARFGQLMSASHASLRDDYEVSIEALDTLVGMLRAVDGVHGARLTGAGFGGACVALCSKGNAARIGGEVVERFNAGGGSASLLLPNSAIQ
jgi:galactokinase